MLPQIGVQLTTRCNMHCAHCYADLKGDDIPVALIEKIAAHAKALGASRLDFTGGEPTLHPHFGDILNILARKDLNFALVSNGWNFADSYKALERHFRRMERIDFSLDGATERVHDGVRALGSYRRLLQAVSICRAKGVRFGLRTTLTRRNIHDLEDIAFLAAKLGADELALMPLMPTPRTAELGLLLHPTHLRRIENEACRLQKILTMKIVLTTGYLQRTASPACPALNKSFLFVTARGDLSFCCHLADYVGGKNDTDIVIENLSQASLAEACQRMFAAIDYFNEAKARHFAHGAVTQLDHYPCWYCLKHFQKVGWLLDFLDNPWAVDLLASRRGGIADSDGMTKRLTAGGHGRTNRNPPRFRQHPDVIETPLDRTEAALIHLGKKLPFHLNHTGLRVWRLLKQGRTIEEVVDALDREFDIDPNDVRKDVAAFVEELLTHGLVVADT